MSKIFHAAIDEVAATNNTRHEVMSRYADGGIINVESMKPMAFFVRLLADLGYDAKFTKGPTKETDEGPDYSFTIEIRGLMNRIR